MPAPAITADHALSLLWVRLLAWPTGSAFGWCAAEAAAASPGREHGGGRLALGRNETLAAAYWRRGAAGLMAG
ncbi:SIP domain-containing protein [Mesorhizobium sp. M0767]|uniref:SIP domain-containing protein n=1 Tax=Mesorhizobium sp. M0767 TaxID=2956995 RepID=UPI0033365AA9